MQPNLFVEPSIYNKPFPNFNLPKIIGYIGLENLKFTKRVCNERVCFDLNLGLKNAIVKDDFDVKLTELLKFLCEHIFRLNCIFESKLESARFYCYRGLLTLVACTPYENREPWKLVAVLHKGNIFLCARDTEDKIMRKRNMTEHDKKFTSWGYKFEQFMLSGKMLKITN